jgi:hypothetical protein
METDRPLNLESLHRVVDTLSHRVARLDTHSSELARELLDTIGRLDAAHQRITDLESKLDAVTDELLRHQDDEGRHGRDSSTGTGGAIGKVPIRRSGRRSERGHRPGAASVF